MALGESLQAIWPYWKYWGVRFNWRQRCELLNNTLLVASLEKAMAPHSSTLAWKIPWMEGPGGLHPWGLKESDMTERLHFHFSLTCTGEGNGNPLQCSCLENPRDGEAWWAAIYGIAQSQIRLTRLSSSSSLSHNENKRLCFKCHFRYSLSEWLLKKDN